MHWVISQWKKQIAEQECTVYYHVYTKILNTYMNVIFFFIHTLSPQG